MKKQMYLFTLLFAGLLFVGSFSANGQHRFHRVFSPRHYGFHPDSARTIDSATVAQWVNSLKANLPDSATLAAIRDSIHALIAERKAADSVARAQRDSIRQAIRDSIVANMPDSATIAQRIADRKAMRDSLRALYADSTRPQFVRSTVAPNPVIAATGGSISFASDDSTATHTLVIYGPGGTVEATVDFTGNTVDVPTLSVGYYYYVITGGDIVSRGRLVVN